MKYMVLWACLYIKPKFVSISVIGCHWFRDSLLVVIRDTLIITRSYQMIISIVIQMWFIIGKNLKTFEIHCFLFSFLFIYLSLSHTQLHMHAYVYNSWDQEHQRIGSPPFFSKILNKYCNRTEFKVDRMFYLYFNLLSMLPIPNYQ